jgi:F420-dependent oxidoreductase-like protein
MKLGIQFFPDPAMSANGANLWDAVAAFAQAAEESGLDSFWMWDHLQRTPAAGEGDSQDMPECFVALGGVAAITRRLTLGQLVTAVPYRNPAIVAKMANTLDVMSHGRSVLGLGAGWDRGEMIAYGIPFDDVPTRMKRLEEAVQLTLALWKQRPASYSGTFYSLDHAYNDPIPPSMPHPPLMVGGGGEKVTLRICAQYADWCNIGGSPEVFGHRVQVLHEHCRRLGRDPSTLTHSNFLWTIIAPTQAEADAKREALGSGARPFYGVVGSPDALIAQLGDFARAGSEHCIVQLTGETDPEAVRLLGEKVAPALREMGALATRP